MISVLLHNYGYVEVIRHDGFTSTTTKHYAFKKERYDWLVNGPSLDEPPHGDNYYSDDECITLNKDMYMEYDAVTGQWQIYFKGEYVFHLTESDEETEIPVNFQISL